MRVGRSNLGSKLTLMLLGAVRRLWPLRSLWPSSPLRIIGGHQGEGSEVICLASRGTREKATLFTGIQFHEPPITVLHAQRLNPAKLPSRLCFWFSTATMLDSTQVGCVSIATACRVYNRRLRKLFDRGKAPLPPKMLMI
eukprot:s1070_g18.t1